MPDADLIYPRGSEWRQWDLHVHTPASYHWEGEKFNKTTDEAIVAKLIDEVIVALNEAEPQVFAFMDYWTFDGWFALKKRLLEDDAPKLTKTVFPGIELRLSAPMPGRLNAHVIFSNDIEDQYLHDFCSNLKLSLIDRPLSEKSLIDYARTVGADKLAHHGFDKTSVDGSSETALNAGYHIAELTVASYAEALQKLPAGMAVGFMPFNTNDGLGSVKWNEHYAFALSLFRSSPIFEARDHDTWGAFAGVRTDGNAKWFDAFQSALSSVPRLAVSGSDAHRLRGTTGENNKRGYGDFPSSKITWIKADPTWLGLLQAIKEPAKRSYIGLKPTKLERINLNKTFYIDRISVNKVADSALASKWLDGCDIELNADLVAIIGNKGSGKSALADVLALLGNSQQQAHFSFLKKDRFRGKSGEPARQFTGQLHWMAGAPGEMVLCDDPPLDRVEMVKYIPQGRFEALCNDHVSGRSNSFEDELRDVIFSHVPAGVRLEALTFNQLIERQEGVQRTQLDELRKKLGAVNQEIVGIEDQLHPNVRLNIEDQLKLKLLQIGELQTMKPAEHPAPTLELSDDQRSASDRLSVIAGLLADSDLKVKAANERKRQCAERRRAVRAITERLSILETQVQDLKAATSTEFTSLGIEFESVVSLKTDTVILQGIEALITSTETLLDLEIANEGTANTVLVEEQKILSLKLNEPQQKHQAYLVEFNTWQSSINEIEGNAFEPESKVGLETRLAQISGLPDLLVEKRLQRAGITQEIYNVLSAQRNGRAMLFAPLQQLIQTNRLIRDEYKLQFQAALGGSYESIATHLFTLVKQNVGELRGDDESFSAIRSRFDKRTFESSTDAVSFASDIEALFFEASRQSQPVGEGISAIMRKDRSSVEVYDYLFGLDYLEPKYTLLFQDTQIEQLSPGQRGALLLIFYLLVDKGRNPIVLDQPEENLDNETVVSLLVPVLNEAKKNRQIIMVTHNPNLAVVCDAEQIIFAEFERKDGPSIQYTSGSIENTKINQCVVRVLEGTKPAFNNRSEKYH